MDVDVALRGMQLASGACYTGEEIKVVARMLLDSPPYHAVSLGVLASAVGGVGGASGLSAIKRAIEQLSGVSAIERGMSSLEAMVEANFLAYRLMSSLSRDIPPEVFEGGSAVGSALTPAHLHALRLARKQGRL